MITVHASDRRFWLLSAPGGLLRLIGVLIFGIILVLIGLLWYDNIATSFVFGLCVLLIMIFISRKPKQFDLMLTENALTLVGRTLQLSEIDAWTIIDLEEKAQLIFRTKAGHTLEAYIQKEELAESGLVNELTQKIPFNPDLVSSNVVQMLLRLLNLA